MQRSCPSGRNRSRIAFHVVCGFWAALPGCQWAIDDADREVSRLIETRQQRSLSETREAGIGRDEPLATVSPTARSFTPSPIDSNVPESFQTPTTQPVTSAPTTTAPAEAVGPTRTLGLRDALAIAFARSREFQTAKEDLYLAALALSLERHLWTPQFVGEMRANYTNFGQIQDFDQAAEAVAEVGVQQRLPWGGDVSAQLITTLMRDLTEHVTTAETGQAILSANVPLLRGAGPVAFESRFQAERDLIYAVRAFERFRRTFAVSIAGDFFDLQRLRQEMLNSRESIKIFQEEVARAEAFQEKERLIPLEVQRAEQNLLVSINTEVDAREQYQTAVDRFKIRLGLPISERIDVTLPAEPGEAQEDAAAGVDDPLERAMVMPAIDEAGAIRIALKYRLDLLNDFDRIGDAERGVDIAQNGLLPDLNASGSVVYDSNPEQLRPYRFDESRATWQAGLALELPLDRKAERNDLRRSLILKRRAERAYDIAQDTVRFEVRRAMRRVEQENTSLQIQSRSRDLAILRRSHARFLFDRGKVSNREVVEAEDALLNARNRLAQAQARVRLAILEFRRDTGTLRINDDGNWVDDLVGAGATD